SALFLFFVFAFIWLSVRWRAQRSVQKVLNARWSAQEPGSGLEGIAREWGEGLLGPLEAEKTRMDELENERERLQRELSSVG
ncbi:MAG: hypothetical protein KC931_22695, partial [Candidatus Omnitrophica bacterium]|nr:hypothetical protein [Candidatus Omnitrophota bacterium]